MNERAFSGVTMFRTALLCLLLVLPDQIAAAACAGTDLWPTLPEADRAAIEAAVDDLAYPRGNFWRATRGKRSSISSAPIISTIRATMPLPNDWPRSLPPPGPSSSRPAARSRKN